MSTRKLFSRIGFGYVLFFLADVAFQILFMVILQVIAALLPGFEVSASLLSFFSQFGRYGCAFPLMWLWMRQIPSWQKPKPEKLSVGTLILIAVFIFGLSFMGNIVGQLLMGLHSLVTGMPAENPVVEMVEELGLVNLFLYTVIVAPLMEELLFRKIMIDRMIPYGQKAAVLISGIAFGLYHGNFYQFFYASLIGMVFAYLYSLTGTFWYGVILHAILNFFGGFFSAFVYTYLGETSLLSQVYTSILGIFLLTCMVAAIVFIFVFKRRVRWFPGWASYAGDGFWHSVLLAPGVLGYFLVCLLMFIAPVVLEVLMG